MTRLRLPRMLRVREKTARAELVCRKANRRHQPAIEVLEQRLEMAQVSWTGLGDGTTWQVAKNWSSNAVPGASDDVTINVANNPTIIYNGTSTIQSLVDNDTLSIAGGSLTVTSGLTVGSGATLSATNAGTSFTASGTTTINAANLYANNGAVLAFPSLTSYAGLSSSATTIQANGAGSVVDLSHLTTLAGGPSGSFLYVNALAGGKVNLSNLTSYTAGATGFDADGSANGTPSTIDLSKLTGLFSDSYYNSRLVTTNGGTIVDPLLATLNRTDLTTDGTSTLGTSQITTYTNGTITANGGTPNYSGLTSLNGDNIYANNGAVLAFPNLTSYAGLSSSATAIQANGAGSVVDLSHLTTLAGGPSGSFLYVNALAGGKVNLSNLTSYTAGATGFDADGSANGTPSTIDLSKLTGLFSDSYYNSRLVATNGGTIVDPLLATLNRTDLTTDGTSTLGTSQITTYTNGTITANGGTPNYSGLTSLNGDNIYANNGAVLAFPNLTSYAGLSSSATAIQANGAGSVVDLSHLTTLAGGPSGSFLYVNALAGGKVNLSNLTSYTAGATGFDADGSANGTPSTIDLSKLTGLFSDSYYNSRLVATNGGTIVDPLLATLNRTDLTTDGTSTLGTSQITTYTNGTITANGGTPNYSGLTSLNGDNIYANNGAVLAFPNLTSYAGLSSSATTIQANGAGSVVDLSHLTTLAGGPSGSFLYVNALAGGKVNLSNLTSYTAGATGFDADGSANGTPSTIDLSKLTGLFSDSYYNSRLVATNGGTIVDPLLATLNRTDLTTDGTSTLGTSQITTYTNGTITANGGTPNYSGLTSLNGDNIYANNGAVLAFPSLTSYAAQNSSTIQANGAGSVVDLSHLTTLAGAPYWPLSVNALAGGKVDLSSLASYTGGVTRFTADGAANGTASTIDLSKLTKLFSDSYNNSWLQATNGGTIVLNSGTVNLMGVDVSAASTGTIVGGALQLFRGTLSGSATLSGDGTIHANVSNSGVTSPGNNGVGTLTITGNYGQAGSGTLNIELASLTSFDQLAVGGSATLNGTLNVAQLNGFSPMEGNAFPILTFASRSGDFSTKTGLGLPNSLALNPVYNATSLTLQTSITTAANISLVSTANPSVYGQSLTFNVTVAPITSGLPTPTGTVQFQLDATNWGQSITLVNGAAASPAIANLAAGSHTITVLYSGDTTYTNSSDTLQQTVNTATLTVAADPKTKLYGDAVPALTYTISGFVLGENAGSAGVTGSPNLSTTATASSPVAGSPYAISVDPGTLAASNYTFATQAGTLTVTNAHLTVTADNQTKIQGNPNPTLTYQISGFVNGDTQAVVSGAPALSTTATTGSPAGNYPITVSAGTLAAANYDFPAANLVPGTLTVVAQTGVSVAVSPNTSPSTYGQAVTFSVTVSPTSAGPTPTGTVQFQADGVNFGSAVTLVNGAATSAAISSLAAGGHAITAIYSGDSAYPNSSGSTSQTVNKAHLTVTAGDQSMTYGGTVPTPTYTITGFVNGDTSAAVSGTPTLTPGATSASPVGTYAITVSQGSLSAANYDFPAANLVPGTLTVNTAHLTVTADNQTKIQGSPNPTLTYTLSGFVNGDTSSVVSGAAMLSTTATTSSPVGSYPITIGAGTLAAANYDFPAANLIPGTLTVVAQTGVLVAVSPSTNPSTYGQSVTFSVTVSPVTAGATPTGTVQFQADGTNLGSAITLVNGTATSPAIANLSAGGHAITAIYSGDSTYPNSSGSTSQTVNKAHLTVTAGDQSMTYGGTVPTPAYTITGFVNGDTSSVVSGTPILTPGATSASPVGTYAITVSQGSLSAANYDFPAANLVPGTLTVNTAHLTVTADNQTKIQGSPNPTLTYTLSGFVNGDTSSVVSGAAMLSTTATTSSPVGSYPITIGAGTLAAANYDFPAANLIPGTLTVVAQTGVLVAVSPSTNPSTYGQSVTFSVTVSPVTAGATPTGTVQFQADGTNLGSAITLVNGAATSPAIANLSAGGHAITAIYSGDSTYPNSSGSTSQTVNKAHLTVTAGDQSMTYGGTVPTPAYTITGFVNGDTSSVVSGTPILTPGATSASPVGTYAITVSAGSLSAANYDFPAANLISGTLTVNQAHLTVTADNQTKIQGSPNPTLTYTFSGFVNGDTSSVVSGAATLSTTATTSSPVGSYPITIGAGTLAAANYDFPTLVNGTLTITVATLIAPDLAVFASDITFSPAHPDPGQPVTLSAVIRNLGPADASNITVAALDFGSSIGSLTIPSLGAGASTQVSFGPMVFPESYRLITIEVDPGHLIQELNENNNEASVVLEVGQPVFSVSGATIVVQTDPASAYEGGVVPIQGRADYDFLAVPGTQNYPVQGGRVTITIEDPATSQVIATFTGTHTLVDGSFSQPILAPAEVGTYTVITEVTDSTVTSTASSTLTVTQSPNPNPPLPTVPPSGGSLPTGVSVSPTFGTITVGNPPPAPGDVFVNSEDIVFSNQPQNVGDTIFIAAFINYIGATPVHDVPVTINDIFPINGALYSFPIGETTVDFPASPSTSTFAVVTMPWTNSARALTSSRSLSTHPSRNSPGTTRRRA